MTPGRYITFNRKMKGEELVSIVINAANKKLQPRGYAVDQHLQTYSAICIGITNPQLDTGKDIGQTYSMWMDIHPNFRYDMLWVNFNDISDYPELYGPSSFSEALGVNIPEDYANKLAVKMLVKEPNIFIEKWNYVPSDLTRYEEGINLLTQGLRDETHSQCSICKSSELSYSKRMSYDRHPSFIDKLRWFLWEISGRSK